MKPVEHYTLLETGEKHSHRPMPHAWAKLLGLDEHRITSKNVPPWMRRQHVVAAVARVRELQALVGSQFKVEFAPDCIYEDDTAAAGHLFHVGPAFGTDASEGGSLDDRGDLAEQLRAWLQSMADEFQAAADRVAAAQSSPQNAAGGPKLSAAV